MPGGVSVRAFARRTGVFFLGGATCRSNGSTTFFLAGISSPPAPSLGAFPLAQLVLFSKPAHRVRFAFKFVSFAKKKCPARLLPQRTGHICLLFFNGSSIDNLFFILGQNKKAPLTGAFA
jgi:hypothetical protein